jgi:hypothetical protein
MTVVPRPWTLVSVLLTADPQETHMARQRDIRTDLADWVTAIRGTHPAATDTFTATAAPAVRRGSEPVREFSPELDRGRRGAR